MSHRIFFVVAMIALAGCRSEDVLAGENLLPTGGLLSADIDGTHWLATLSRGYRTESGFSVSGTDVTGRNLLLLVRATAVGTYVVGLQGAASATLSERNGPSWFAISTRGSGSVTLTTFST